MNGAVEVSGPAGPEGRGASATGVSDSVAAVGVELGAWVGVGEADEDSGGRLVGSTIWDGVADGVGVDDEAGGGGGGVGWECVGVEVGVAVGVGVGVEVGVDGGGASFTRLTIVKPSC